MREKELYKGFEQALDILKRKDTKFYSPHATLMFRT